MEALLIYLLKASGVLALFYLAYQFFLKRETFFKVNRHFLMTGILMAFVIPFITIPNYIETTPITFENVGSDTILSPANDTGQQTHWTKTLFVIYLIGLVLLTVKFIIQLLALRKLTKKSKVGKQGKFYFVETSTNIAPFSFFNHIFYNPSLYSKNELSAIIKHEKAHSSQWHSIDVIISHLITICTWISPFSWFYQTNIKQNLEFLADESAIKEITSPKKYQYTLLKVTGNQFCTQIVNNFYNSLIKKRIVMLNKSKSSKKNILKIALVLPALAIFLVSFNTKDIYIPVIAESNVIVEGDFPPQIVKITINKNTTDKELLEIKEDLAKKGVDFSYTVVHNSSKEIINISIDFSSKKENGKNMRSSSNFNNGDDPIDPIHIIYDKETNSISMGNAGLIDVHEDKDVHITIHKDVDVHEDVDKETEYNVFVHSDIDGGEELQTIEIVDENGRETIKFKGKKATRKQLKKLKKKDDVNEKHIKIKKHKTDDKNIYFKKDSNQEVDFDHIIGVEEGKGKNTFFINTEDEKNIYIIDGKESKHHDMKSLNPSSIESISVLKGEKARAKYGEKGENKVKTR